VEAGSNTSTTTLRVVGGDEKGSLTSEMVASPTGLGPEKDCADKTSSIYKRQTRPLIRGRAHKKKKQKKKYGTVTDSDMREQRTVSRVKSQVSRRQPAGMWAWEQRN
jgi:hypothetical protein